MLLKRARGYWKIGRSGLPRDVSIARWIDSDGCGKVRNAAGESGVIHDSRAVRAQLQDESMPEDV